MFRLSKYLLRSRINNVCRCVSSSSRNQSTAELAETQARHDSIKIQVKKQQREPLVKNLFLAKVDSELLAFPEVITDNEALQMVYQRKGDYDNFLKSEIFENPDDKANIQKLKDNGCFRANQLTKTELLYGASEPESKIVSYSNFLNSHQQVITLINDCGDESQKLKFLHKLESGQLIAVPCLLEPTFSNDPKKTFNTEAKYRDESEKWILNGAKSFVPIHNKDSTLFLVLASTDSIDRVGDFQESVAVFLVDGSTPGVSISGVDETIGCDETNFQQVTVSFKDVELPKSSAIGLTQDISLKAGSSVLRQLRMDTGVQALTGIMKPLLNRLVEHSIKTKIQEVSLKDMENIRERLGMLTCQYYALESMIFMTAGLMDIYENQDVDVESAMIKSFALDSLTSFISTPLHTVGGKAVVKGEPFEKLIRDACQLSASGETLDSVKAFIGLSGLNHAGLILNEMVKKNRNPLDHPAFVFARIFKQTSIQKPKMTLDLKFSLHPSLDPAAQFLEMSILRLKAATEIVLGRHGPLVVQHPVEIVKLADAATLCYAMWASTARASRSYCIGLRNADQEILAASCFCIDGMEKVKKIAMELDNGEFGTNEHNFKKIGEKLIDSKGYYLESPITRNF